MKIQIGGMSEGTHEYRFHSTAADIGLREGFAGPVEVQAVVVKTGTQVAVNASVEATGAFVCDRCTAPFTLSLRPSFRMYYVMDATGMETLDPSEVQVVPAGIPMIDLTDDVRQTILLSVPLKLLCREDCKGLCPQCGADLNLERCRCRAEETDTRWERLRGFRPEPN